MEGLIGILVLFVMLAVIVKIGNTPKDKAAAPKRKPGKPEPLVWVILDDGRPVQVPAHIAAMLEKKPAEKKPEPRRSPWGVRL